jgi:hypothetical protein
MENVNQAQKPKATALNTSASARSALPDAVEVLDLIHGHLSHETKNKTYSLGLPGHLEPKNWTRRMDVPEHGFSNEAFVFVAKVQPFKSGGYELLCSEFSPKFLPQLRFSNPTGKREAKTALLKENDITKSRQRSRRKVRLLVKSMGCDRLLTLTIRESDPEAYATREQIYLMWKRFVQIADKNGYSIGEYVVVPEKHKKGNYHLHAVINGYVKVNYIRAFWLRVCRNFNKDGGNVDISYKPNLSPMQRAAGCAKYVTKYISKSFEYAEFNKKRYSASRHQMPEARKIILRSRTLQDAIIELSQYLGLKVGNPLQKNSIIGSSFFFSRRTDNDLSSQQTHATGFWLSVTEQMFQPIPF